jgi:hypothetical protein
MEPARFAAKLRNWNAATQCREIGGMECQRPRRASSFQTKNHSALTRFAEAAAKARVARAICLRQNPGVILQMQRPCNAA